MDTLGCFCDRCDRRASMSALVLWNPVESSPYRAIAITHPWCTYVLICWHSGAIWSGLVSIFDYETPPFPGYRAHPPGPLLPSPFSLLPRVFEEKDYGRTSRPRILASCG